MPSQPISDAKDPRTALSWPCTKPPRVPPEAAGAGPAGVQALLLPRPCPCRCFSRHLVTRRRSMANISQLLMIEIPLPLALATDPRISTLTSSLSHFFFIGPTNPHLFFFAISPVPRPARPRPVPFLPILASTPHKHRQGPSWSSPQVGRSDVPGQRLYCAFFYIASVRTKATWLPDFGSEYGFFRTDYMRMEGPLTLKSFTLHD